MPAIEQQKIILPTRSAVPSTTVPIPVWQMALGWILVVPMLYIGTNGILIPRTTNVSFAATGEDPYTPASHKVAVALICLIWVILIGRRFSSVLALSSRMKIMLAFPVLATLSASWSEDPRQSIVSGLLLLMFTAFAIYVGNRFSYERQFELIMLVGAVALPASIVLALFVPSVGTDSIAWRGIFGHKQNCSAVCTLLLITALHWKCSGIDRKIFRVTYIVMCGVLIVMSQSRTGWALALIALLLSGALWLLQRMPAKQAFVSLLLGLPAIAAALYGIYILSPSILVSVGKDATLGERTIIWSAAWDAALQHPILGYGFAAFWRGLYGPSHNIVLVAGWGLTQAQDGFLDVWLGIGVVGVALVALLTVQAMRNAVHSFYFEDTKVYVRWCIVVIICTLLYNIGESSIGLYNMTWFLFLLSSIDLGLVVTCKKEKDKLRHPSQTITVGRNFSHVDQFQ